MLLSFNSEGNRGRKDVTFLHQRRKVTKGTPLKGERCCKIQRMGLLIEF